MAWPVDRSSPGRRIALLGALAAMALAVGQVELLIPLPLPGLKPGLANVFTLAALLLWGPGSAVAVSLVRILLGGLLGGAGFGFLCSLGGGVLSLVASVGLWRCYRSSISTLALSCFAALAHNLGQLIVAGAVIGWRPLIWYGPVMVFTGLATGAVVGMLTDLLIRRLARVKPWSDAARQRCMERSASERDYRDGV